MTRIDAWRATADWQAMGARTILWTIFPALLLFVGRPAESAVPSDLRGFLAEHCGDCHGDGSAEGGFALETLSDELGDVATFEKWEKLFDRVEQETMPPPDSSDMDEATRTAFLKELSSILTAEHASRKGTVLRRLNRREYENTLNDMFGTNLDLASMLPEDGRSHEFDNIGDSLHVSMVQLERYMAAAEMVLDASIAKRTQASEPKVIVANYADTPEGEKHIGKAWGQADDGAVIFFRPLGYPTGMLRPTSTRKAGWYEISVRGYAYRSDKPITFAVGGTSFQRGSDKPTFGYFALPPGEPTTVTVNAWMDERYMVEITPWGISDRDNEIRKNGIDNYQGPGLAILDVTMRGPMESEFPSRGHRLIFSGLDRREIEPSNPSAKNKSWYVPKFEILASQPESEAAKVLKRVATEAFRRPVADDDIRRYVDLCKEQMQQGESLESALRTSVTALLCSPDFLFLEQQTGWLDDHALASRLSYFLTRTAPDKPLRDDADAGKLANDPQRLIHHTRRLLENPLHQRFVTDFCDAWLNLRDIEFTSPDKSLFPEYDAYLQYSMLAETRRFVDHLITEDLSVSNLITSDWAMLNNRLAEHYGIDGEIGPEIRRVALPEGSVRGGILSQASILKVSANGTNTSPVVRGVWLTERILGDKLAPPPPGIPGVEPDIRGATTLREQLDKHRSLDSCQGCHAKIDPPGFALESFNAIGGWRERFRSLGEGERVEDIVAGRRVRYRLGPAVDASGETLEGKSFSGFVEYRRLLAEQPELIAKTLTQKLLAFATGREMGFSDRPIIEKIVNEAADSDYGVRRIIELVVLSPPFRHK